MNETEWIQNTPVPRPEATCQVIARRLAGWLGFLGYGILYLFAVSNTVALVVGVLTVMLARLIFEQPFPGWVDGAMIAVIIGAFLAACIPFVRWIRRRRRVLRELIRDGAILDGTVSQLKKRRIRGAPFTTATLLFSTDSHKFRASVSIGGHDDTIKVGSVRPVLWSEHSTAFVLVLWSKKAVAARFKEAR